MSDLRLYSCEGLHHLLQGHVAGTGLLSVFRILQISKVFLPVSLVQEHTYPQEFGPHSQPQNQVPPCPGRPKADDLGLHHQLLLFAGTGLKCYTNFSITEYASFQLFYRETMQEHLKIQLFQRLVENACIFFISHYKPFNSGEVINSSVIIFEKTSQCTADINQLKNGNEFLEASHVPGEVY